MNASFDRKLIAEIFVMLAVCIGAWMMIVDPQKGALAELEAIIETAKTNPLRASREQIEQMAFRIDAVRTRVRKIESESGLARDSSRTYGLIMGLAKEYDVTVRRLDPSPPGRSADAADPVQVTGFTMNVEGTYERVAMFIEGVQSLNGFVRPGSLSVTPLGNTGAARVTAQFSCEGLSFTLPDSLTVMLESSDAHQ